MPVDSFVPDIFFSRFAQAASIAVILIGCLVITGWAFDITLLRGVFPGFTPMNPGGTALSFILAGTSLWLQILPDIKKKLLLLSKACAAAVLLIAFVRISGYLFNWPDGPDEWLFYDELFLEALRSGHLNQMSPNTAIVFVLVGLALFCFEVRIRNIWFAQLLATISALIALLTIISYIGGVVELMSIQKLIPMALNTAIAFILISTGILFARAGSGFVPKQ